MNSIHLKPFKRGLFFVVVTLVILLASLLKEYASRSNRSDIPYFVSRYYSNFLPSVFWTLVFVYVTFVVYKYAKRSLLPRALLVFVALTGILVFLLPIVGVLVPKPGQMDIFAKFCYAIDREDILDPIVFWARKHLEETNYPPAGVEYRHEEVPGQLSLICPVKGVKPDIHTSGELGPGKEFIAINYYVSRTTRLGLMIGSVDLEIPTNGIYMSKEIRRGVVAVLDKLN